MTEFKKDNLGLGMQVNQYVRAFRRVDLNLFIVFSTIYEYRSLTIASRHLGLTQPAVSRSLARLRETLGDKLFVRKGGESVPTPFSHAIIEDVRKALELFRSGPLGEQVFDPSSSTAHFRVSMDSAMEAFVLQELVEHLSREAPGVTLTSTRIQRRNVETDLARGDLSLAIDVDFPFGQEIRRKPISREDSVVVVRKGNPLTSEGMTQRGFFESQHVVVTSRTAGVAVYDFELARIGHRRNVAVRCTNLRVGLQIVQTTDYMLSLGRKQLEAMPFIPELEVFDFPFPLPEIDTVLYWHESLDSEPGNVWIRGLISDILGSK